MASTLQVKVEGLGTITRVARQLDRKAGVEWRREIRAAGRPMVAEAKSRLRATGSAKSRTTARTVSMGATGRGVHIKMGGRNHPWARPVEFGANRTETRAHNVNDAFGRGFSLAGVVKSIDYSSPKMFGPWTGNSPGAGRGFFPAVRHGLDSLDQRLLKVRDGYVNTLARAG